MKKSLTKTVFVTNPLATMEMRIHRHTAILTHLDGFFTLGMLYSSERNFEQI